MKKSYALILVVVVAGCYSDYQIDTARNCTDSTAIVTEIRRQNVTEKDILSVIEQLDNDTTICRIRIFKTSGKSGRKVLMKYYKESVTKGAPHLPKETKND